MINTENYTKEQIEQLYDAVELAVKNHEGIDLCRIAKIIKPGDFYLATKGPTGIFFTFDGLIWKDENGELFDLLIRAQCEYKNIEPVWMPEITRNLKDKSSWGRLHMISKVSRNIAGEK